MSKNSSILKPILVFLTLFFSFTSSFAVDYFSMTPGDIWLENFESYEKADSYYVSGNYSSAYTLYKKSLSGFQELTRLHPSWNREIVNYRIQTCNERITEINEKINGGKSLPSTQAKASSIASNFSEETDFQSQLLEQQRKLKSVLNQLEKQNQMLSEKEKVEQRLKDTLQEKLLLEQKFSHLKKMTLESNIDAENLPVINEFRNKIASDRLEIEKLQKDKTILGKELSELKLYYNQIVVEKTKTSIEKETYEKQISELAKKQTLSEEKINNLKDEISRVESEKSRAFAKTKRLEAEIEETKNVNRDLNDNLITTQGNSSSLINSLKNENNRLSEKIKSYDSELDKLTSVKNSYDLELKKVRDEARNASGLLSNLTAKYANISSEAELLKKKLSESENINSNYFNKISSLENKLAKESEEYGLLSSKYAKVSLENKELNKFSDKNLKLKEENSKLTKIAETYKNELSELQKEKFKLDEQERNLALAQARILQENLGLKDELKAESALKIKEIETANEEKQKLSNEIGKIKNFLADVIEKNSHSNEKLSEYKLQNEKLRSELSSVDRKFEEVQKKHLEETKRVAELEKSINSSKELEKSLNSIKNELIAQMAEKETKLASALNDNSLKSKQIEKLDSESKSTTEQLAAVKKDLNNKSDEAAKYKTDLENAKKQNIAASEKMSELLSAVKDASNKANMAESIKTDLEKTVKDANAENRRLAEQEKELLNRLESIAKELQTSKSDTKSVAAERDKLINKILDSERLVEQLLAEQNKNKTEVETLKNELANFKNSIKNYSSADYEKLLEKLTEAEKKLAESKNELQKNAAQMAQFADTLQKKEIELDGLKNKYDNLQKVVQENNAKISNLENEKSSHLKQINELLENTKAMESRTARAVEVQSIIQEKYIALNSEFDNLKRFNLSQKEKIEGLQNSLNEEAERAVKLAGNKEQLENKNRDYQNLLSEEQKKNSDLNKIAEALGNVADSFKNDNNLLANELNFSKNKINDLEKEIINNRVEFERRISDINKFNNGAQTLIDEKNKLANEVNNLTDKLEMAQQGYNEQLKKADRLENELKLSGDNAATVKLENDRLKIETNQARVKIEQLEANYKKELTSVEDLKQKLATANSTAKISEELSNKLQNQINSQAEKLINSESEKRRLESKVEEILAALSSREDSLNKLSLGKNMLANELAVVKQEVADMKQKEATKDSKLAEVKDKMNELLKENIELKNSSTRVLSEMKITEGNMNKLAADFQKQADENSKVINALQENESALTISNVKVAELQKRIESVESEKRDLLNEKNALSAEFKNIKSELESQKNIGTQASNTQNLKVDEIKRKYNQLLNDYDNSSVKYEKLEKSLSNEKHLHSKLENNKKALEGNLIQTEVKLAAIVEENKVLSEKLEFCMNEIVLKDKRLSELENLSKENLTLSKRVNTIADSLENTNSELEKILADNLLLKEKISNSESLANSFRLNEKVNFEKIRQFEIEAKNQEAELLRKDMVISSLSDDIKKSKAEYDELFLTKEMLTKKLNSIQSELVLSEKKFADIMDSKKIAESVTLSQKSTLESLTIEKDKLGENIILLNSKIKEANKNLAETKLESLSTKKALLDAEIKFEEVIVERDNLKNRVSTLENSLSLSVENEKALKQKNEEFEHNYSEINKNFSELKAEYSAKINEYNLMKNELAEYEVKYNRLNTAKDEDGKFIKIYSDKIVELEELNRMSLIEVRALENKLRDNEAKVKETERLFASVQKEREKTEILKIETDTLRNNIEDLKLKNSELEGRLKNHKVFSYKNDVEKEKKSHIERKKDMLLLVKSGNQSLSELDTVKALKYYKLALQYEKDNTLLTKKIAGLEFSIKNYANASIYFELLKNAEPNDTENLISLGVCYMNLNEPYKALSVFSAAAVFEKDNPVLMKYLGFVCAELGWHDAAATHLKQAFEAGNKSADVAFSLAKVLIHTDPPNLEEAKKWYDTAVKNGLTPDVTIENTFKSM